mmetsp:Transcript_23816/g.82361  ORF Transcript_23816/g.82361 Transcript_23816/m.82361 type:complete len:203 (+) Transcript_23816:364-972(+)
MSRTTTTILTGPIRVTLASALSLVPSARASSCTSRKLFSASAVGSTSQARRISSAKPDASAAVGAASAATGPPSSYAMVLVGMWPGAPGRASSPACLTTANNASARGDMAVSTRTRSSASRWRTLTASVSDDAAHTAEMRPRSSRMRRAPTAPSSKSAACASTMIAAYASLDSRSTATSQMKGRAGAGRVSRPLHLANPTRL